MSSIVCCVCCVCCLQDFWWVSSRFLGLSTGPHPSTGAVMADFGQTDFGHRYPTDFGQAKPSSTCVCVFACVCVCGVGVGFTVLVWSCSVPGDRPSLGPPFPWTGQKVALFFSLSRRKIRSFLPSLGVWCVFQGRDPQSNVHVSALRLPCETPAASGPPGLHTTTRELQTCTYEGPGLQKHHQNSTKRPPEREEKNEFCGGRGKKKRDILGTLRTPTLLHPTQNTQKNLNN